MASCVLDDQKLGLLVPGSVLLLRAVLVAQQLDLSWSELLGTRAPPKRSSSEIGLWCEPMARVVVEDEQGEDGPTWVLDIEQVSAELIGSSLPSEGTHWRQFRMN